MQQALTSPLVDLFLELCAMPSPSGSERAVADRVAAYLTDLGLEWDEDDAASRLDGDAGNIYCRIPPTTGSSGTPIFLCAHTDTVPPETTIDPVVGEDGIVRNAAGTILGSDNKAAVVVMLEAVRHDPGRGVGSTRGSSSSSRRRRRCRYAAPTRSITRDSLRRRVTSTTRARPSARSCWARRMPDSSTSASTAPPRTPACTRRTAARPSPRRRGRSPTSVSAVSTRRRARTSASFPAAPRETSSPSGAPSRPRCARTTRRKAVDLAREMLESAAFAASLADCEVESEVRPSFPGYRFRESDPPVRLAAEALSEPDTRRRMR